MTKLKLFRLSAGLSQWEVEEATKKRIKRWRQQLLENGFSEPTQMEIEALSSLFGVTPDQLFGISRDQNEK